MFAGHFGLAAAVKAKQPDVPLWALMLGTQLLDVAFVPLLLAGVETIEPIAGSAGYGASIIHADYTHSLVGALLIALIAAILAGFAWGRRSGTVMGGVVFSHWLLDLLVHRHDLPLLPGNAGNLPLLGFGWWAVPGLSMAAEALLIVVGGALYFRSVLKRASAASSPRGADRYATVSRAAAGYRSRAVAAGVVMCVLLMLLLLYDTLLA